MTGPPGETIVVLGFGNAPITDFPDWTRSVAGAPPADGTPMIERDNAWEPAVHGEEWSYTGIAYGGGVICRPPAEFVQSELFTAWDSVTEDSKVGTPTVSSWNYWAAVSQLKRLGFAVRVDSGSDRVLGKPFRCAAYPKMFYQSEYGGGASQGYAVEDCLDPTIWERVVHYTAGLGSDITDYDALKTGLDIYGPEYALCPYDWEEQSTPLWFPNYTEAWDSDYNRRTAVKHNQKIWWTKRTYPRWDVGAYGGMPEWGSNGNMNYFAQRYEAGNDPATILTGTTKSLQDWWLDVRNKIELTVRLQTHNDFCSIILNYDFVLGTGGSAPWAPVDTAVRREIFEDIVGMYADLVRQYWPGRLAYVDTRPHNGSARWLTEEECQFAFDIMYKYCDGILAFHLPVETSLPGDPPLMRFMEDWAKERL